MADTTNKFFQASEKQAELLDRQQDITSNFIVGGKAYYVLDSVNFVSSKVMEDDDGDLDKEYAKAKDKVQKIANVLLGAGVVEITAKEYKTAEKVYKESLQKTFLDNFTAEERFAYDKTKEFINSYGFETGSQKSFLTSLRPLIVNQQEVTVYTLDEIAQKGKKELDNIFDVGQQEMVVDFVTDLQAQVKNFAAKRKMKI